MKLWGGRFTKETNQLVNNFNASLPFDRRFYKQDIEGSIAHVTMLAKQGILSNEDKEAIIAGLTSIRNDIDSGALQFDDEAEDIHSFVEVELISRIGDAGKRLHTGRSRNDQVALDMRLYTRDELTQTDELLKGLLKVILRIMKENTETYMPGFTHLQKAQPITVAHHFGAYFEMFSRDRGRITDIYKRMNYCPLGAGALAGTPYPLDREYTASLLGFTGATANSIDSVSDRDYLIEFLSAMSTIMMHLSRFSEEIIIWNSNEYRFIELDDAYSTGSSIMPQKKNPDIAELVRGKTGRVYGALMSLLTTMKGTASRLQQGHAGGQGAHLRRNRHHQGLYTPLHRNARHNVLQQGGYGKECDGGLHKCHRRCRLPCKPRCSVPRRTRHNRPDSPLLHRQGNLHRRDEPRGA